MQHAPLRALPASKRHTSPTIRHRVFSEGIAYLQPETPIFCRDGRVCISPSSPPTAGRGGMTGAGQNPVPPLEGGNTEPVTRCPAYVTAMQRADCSNLVPTYPAGVTSMTSGSSPRTMLICTATPPPLPLSEPNVAFCVRSNCLPVAIALECSHALQRPVLHVSSARHL